MTSIAPTLDEPKATAQHTLCGYAWGDVTGALIRAIGTADMTRALRWSAELVCSETGLGRLEATLLHAWAIHVGPAHPTWVRSWYNNIHQLRTYWTRTHGDTRAIRNTPVVRQLVAESTAVLVLAAKKPLPSLPTAADCFREAEGMRTRLRAGGGVGDQSATRRVWSAGSDGADLRTIGNEMEAALRGGQTSRLLFWIIWMFTLDKQKDAPVARERGPSALSVKARKSLLWFLIAVLRAIADEGIFLAVEERNGLFGALETCWVKLGERGRRDVVAAIALCISDHLMRRGTLSVTGPTAPPSHDAVRGAIARIDELYASIGAEARKYMLERPVIAGLTAEAEREPRRGAEGSKPSIKLTSDQKLAMVYGLFA